MLHKKKLEAKPYNEKGRNNNDKSKTISISSVQSLSCAWLYATPWITAYQAPLSITNSRSSPKLMSTESVMPSSHPILCHPLFLLPPIPPSIRVLSNESTLRMRWPKYWSFSFNISPSNEHPGLIFFRMDWLDLLAVQGTLKSLFQLHSSKASTLQRSAFFIVQLSHPYMTTGKTIALTKWTFAGKVISLLLNMLSRLVIDFLPRSKCLLISWLQLPSAVILETKKIKSLTVSKEWIAVPFSRRSSQTQGLNPSLKHCRQVLYHWCYLGSSIWGAGWAPKSLQMVTAAMKLKDICSLEEKLWSTESILKSRDTTLLT